MRSIFQEDDLFPLPQYAAHAIDKKLIS